MTTFLLIRHGRTALVGKALAGRNTDVPIDDVGLSQAQRLVDRLASWPIHAIYSSPLQRAVQSAEPLASHRRLPVQIRPNLVEIDFGAWSGITFQQLDSDPNWVRFNSFRSSSSAPAGESILDLQKRMVLELEELRSLHPDQTVALFSHGELIRSAVIHYAGIPIDLSLRISIDPASVTSIALASWGPKILGVNTLESPA